MIKRAKEAALEHTACMLAEFDSLLSITIMWNVFLVCLYAYCSFFHSIYSSNINILSVGGFTMKNVPPALYSAKSLQSRLENKIDLSVAVPGFLQ